MALTRRQLALSREIAAAQTVSAAAVLVADTAGALEREAALLARDPALVEGAAKGDWATVARFGSPRIQALTREGVAEFVVVRDVIGAPLLQVPAVPPPAVPSFTALTRPIVTLKVINGRPLLLVAAPIWSAGSTDGASRIPVGMIVAGRRFEDLGRAIEQLSMRPGLVVLAGDRLVAATRPGMPEAGWVTAVTSGRTTIGSESFMLHPLRPEIIDSADGALWILVPDPVQSAAQRKLWTWLAGLFTLAAAGLAVGSWALVRSPRRGDRSVGAEPVEPSDPGPLTLGGPSGVSEQRDLAAENARLIAEAQRNAAEYQALFEVAGLVGSTLNVDRVLDLIVDRCRALMDVASAGLFRLNIETGVLAYERGLGLSADFISAPQAQVGAGTTGKALRDRVPVWSADILHDEAIVLAPETRDLVMREGYRAALSAPIIGSASPHGVLSVYWGEPHEPTESEVALMSALAAQAAIALDNAQLYGAVTARGKRLATLAHLTETLTATLALEDVLSRVVHSAVELYGSSVSRLWLVEEDGQSLSLRAHAGTVAPLLGVTRLGLGEGLMGRIVAERAPIVVSDLSRDSRVKDVEHVQAESTISFAGVPLTVGDRVLGALSVALREVRRFSDEDLSLLHSLANHAAIAIENARLFGEERADKAYLAALLEVNKKIGALAPAEPLLQTIAEEAARLLDVDNAGFRLLEGDELVVAGLSGTARATMIRPRIKAWESLSGKVVTEGRALICEMDTMPDLIPEHRAAGQRLGYTTFMGIPLRVGDRTIGVLTFRARRHFSPSDQEIAEAFAGQAAIVIENARLYSALDVRAGRLRTLARLSNVVSSSLDADAVLHAVAKAAAEIMSASFVAVYVADEAGRTLELRAASDERMGAALPDKRRPFGEGLVGWVAEHRRPLKIADVLADERAKARDWARTYGLRSFLGVPIIFQDSLLGVLTLNDPAPLHLEADDEDLLESFVSQAAVAIRNTRLYADTAKHLEQTRAMLEVAEILNSTLDPRRVLKQVAIKIAQVCRVDRCTIERWDGDRVIPLMSQFADGRKDERLWTAFMNLPSYPPREVPAHAQAIETRRPVVIADATSTDLIPREWIETFAHKSYMVVPLIRQDAVIGVMNLDYVELVTSFERWQMDLAMAIAGQLALTIENTRLYSEAQERLRETTTLLEVARVMSQPGPAGEVMRRTAREVARAFGADMVGVYVLDERKEALVPVAGYHVPKHLLHVFSTRLLAFARCSLLREAWDTGRASWSADVINDPRIDDDTFKGVDSHAMLFAPTMVRGHAIGALFLVWWGAGRQFQPAEVRLIEGVASQVGLAMDNAELARQTQAKLEELSVLHELSRAVTGQLDQADLLDTIQQQMARLLDVRHMVILLQDESTDGLEVMLRVKDGVRRPDGPTHYPRGADGLSGIVRDTARPIRTGDYLGECARRGVDPVPESVDLPHWLGVPMIAGSRTLGVLALRSRDRAFTEGDQRLLGSIADLTALALRSARLYEERTRAHSALGAAQDQLVRTEKLRAMGEMASGMAHDFNNVLAAILGRAELLLGRVQDPKLRQWLQVIERSALDGARTVRRLQDFTRIRRDHPVVAVDVNQVVQQTLEATESTWRRESQRRGVHIDVVTSLATPLPQVSGDPAELREALTNLILNALDAMPGGGTLTLTTRAAHGDVEIGVADTGSGIPAAIRNKIFDPFFTTKGPRGTGLGLAMTYGILARHGARITVESEQGHGATFRLVFPAVDHAAEPVRPADTPPAPASCLRCLVVDDEEDVAAVLGDMLLSEGHDVQVVSGGQEAVARCGAESFDLVLTDLAMPAMSGWDVARAIKSMAPATRVVLVSGFGVEVSAEDLRGNGVDLVLAKPLKLRDIKTAVALARSV